MFRKPVKIKSNSMMGGSDKNEDMEEEDLELQELEGDAATELHSQSVRKNISLKLKGKAKGTKGRPPKNANKAKKVASVKENEANYMKHFIIDDDISNLEPPTFTTLDNRGPSEPLHQSTPLRWDYKVDLIGEKVVNPMIHCCEKCTLPILVYGRMIPCKHIFCVACAKRAAEKKVCPRCNEKVYRFETTGLGSVFLCTFGGSRHGNAGCRRTYLSQRDLQAHTSHRHLKSLLPTVEAPHNLIQHPLTPKSNVIPPISLKDVYDKPHSIASAYDHSGTTSHLMTSAEVLNDPRLAYHRAAEQTHGLQYNSAVPPPPYASAASVIPSRTNLITINIQDDHVNAGEYQSAYHHPPPQTAYPPPQPQQFNHPPPGHPYHVSYPVTQTLAPPPHYVQAQQHQSQNPIMHHVGGAGQPLHSSASQPRYVTPAAASQQLYEQQVRLTGYPAASWQQQSRGPQQVPNVGPPQQTRPHYYNA